MADRAVARRTGSVSALGGRLDTAADFLFTAAAMAKLLPLLPIPLWLWIWIAAMAGIKIANVAVGLIRQKKLVTVHSVYNRITGLCLFLFPLTLRFIEWKFSAVLLCTLATLSAVHEGYVTDSVSRHAGRGKAYAYFRKNEAAHEDALRATSLWEMTVKMERSGGGSLRGQTAASKAEGGTDGGNSGKSAMRFRR